MAYIKIPRDTDAESAVLGSILLRPNSMAEVLDILSPESFYQPSNAEVYEVMTRLFKKGEPIDMITVSAEAKKDPNTTITKSHIATLTSEVMTSSHILSYAKNVADKYQRRVMMQVAEDLRDSLQDEDVEAIESMGSAISSLTGGIIIGGDNPDASNSLDLLKESIDEFRASTNGLLGVSTGIQELDKKLYGMRKGHFGVLTAYSSTGKSAIALNITASFIKEGKKVVFFSLEMSGSQIMARLISIISGISTWIIERGEANETQKIEVLKAIELIKNSGLRTYIDCNWKAIQMTMVKESVGSKADLFVLDYLQLVTTEDKNEYAGMTRVSKELQKNLQRFKIPMLALSQISNEDAKEGNPFIMSTKGSGGIAASADWVILLQNAEQDMEMINDYKERKVPLPIKCFIQKHRHGPTGMIEMHYQTETGIFMDKHTYKAELYQRSLDQILQRKGDKKKKDSMSDFSDYGM